MSDRISYKLISIVLLLFVSSVTVAQVFTVGEIKITGNQKTHPKIILRELGFQQNSQLDSVQLNLLVVKAKENLLNTGLFNFAETSVQYTDSHAVVFVHVVERWYIWPFPVLEEATHNWNAWLQDWDLGKLNYGFYLVHFNFRGRNELLRTKVRLGFREQYAAAYGNPGFNSKKTWGYEVKYMYFRQKKIVVGTVENKQLFLFSPSFVYAQHVASASIKHRPGLYAWHTATVQYETHRVDDTVTALNNDFLPGRSNASSFIRFEYDLQIDYRNSKYYPLRGWFFEMDALYYHFITGKEKNLTLLKGSAAWYQPLGTKWFVSAGLSGDYALERDLPYLLSQSFGYYNFSRGYELYVVDGRGWSILRSGMKYQLVSPHVGKMKFLKNERFSKFHYSLFLGAFYDGGYVYGKQNNDNMTDTWLGGYGLGLDFVTYYDQVFRLEVSNNKFNQIGIFVHFSAPF